MTLMIYRIFFLLYFISVLHTRVFGQLGDERKFELDSITSFIPKNQLPNLDSVHAYLHKEGKTDEERIWMFYGYLGTYFKYDYERLKDYKAPYFSPHYTAQRKKGVCRDYARVLEYLCRKSSIPCLIVTGKVPEKLLVKLRKKIHGISLNSNHQWNVVYFNNTWHLMDPTWSSIKEKTKRKTWDTKRKQYVYYTLLRSERTYFDPSPEFMAKTHVPVHPAFLLMDTVFSYKTSLKKEKKQKIFDTHYKYIEQLDTLLSFENPVFSKIYNEEALAYSSSFEASREFQYLLSESKWKTARYFTPTLEYYDERVSYVKKQHALLQENMGQDFSNLLVQFEAEMLNKKKKLALKLAKEKNQKNKRVL